MNRTLPVAMLVLAVAAGAARAQSNTDTAREEAAEAGRFTLLPGGQGFVRLDRQTGQVSYCTIAQERLTCRLAADERDAYEREIARLERRLPRQEIPPQARPEPPSVAEEEQERQFEKAMDYAERALRRLFETVEQLRTDLERRLETR